MIKSTFKERLTRLLVNNRLMRDPEAVEWARWYADQQWLLESGKEIEPPWIAFPHSESVGGWNQGYNEEWKRNVWMPFWSGLSDDERNAYFERWQPSEDWRQTLTEFWGSEVRTHDS